MLLFLVYSEECDESAHDILDPYLQLMVHVNICHHCEKSLGQTIQYSKLKLELANIIGTQKY